MLALSRLLNTITSDASDTGHDDDSEEWEDEDEGEEEIEQEEVGLALRMNKESKGFEVLTHNNCATNEMTVTEPLGNACLSILSISNGIFTLSWWSGL